MCLGCLKGILKDEDKLRKIFIDKGIKKFF